VRPPTWDSPTTRGLFDTSTGVYWSSDAFVTPVLGLVDHVADLPGEMLAESCMAFSSMLSPWHEVVDPTKFDAWVDRVAALDASVIVGAHGPQLTGSHIDLAIDRMRKLPATAVAPLPDQRVLDQILGMLQPA
jgi:hypothetical protein